MQKKAENIYVDTKKWESATYDFDRVLLRVFDT